MIDDGAGPDPRDAAWTDSWFAAAGRVPAERRRDWLVDLLDDAPALAELNPADRAALLVACADLVDFSDARALRLAGELVTSSPPDAARGESFMRRLLAWGVEPDLSRRLRMRLAIGASVRDEPEAATSWFRDLLEETRGEGSEFEVRVLVNWSTLLTNQGRLLEAMVCLRRAEVVLEGVDSPRALAYVLLKRAEVAKNLGHTQSETELFERVDELLASHELPDVLHLRLRQGVYSHVERRDFEKARRMLERLDDEGRGVLGDRLSGITLTMARADIALGDGDLDEAWRLTERLESEFGDFAHVEVVVTELRQLLHEADGDLPALRDEAERALGLLEHSARRGDGWSYVMTRAARIFERLRGRGPEALERRAADLAVTASLERIREVDRLLRAESGYTDLHAEDRALLGAFRMRFLAQNRDLCRRVAERIARSPDDLARWTRERVVGDDGFTVVCAWCQQVSADQGHWLPLGHLIAEAAEFRATHGACPGCVDDMTARLEVRRSG